MPTETKVHRLYVTARRRNNPAQFVNFPGLTSPGALRGLLVVLRNHCVDDKIELTNETSVIILRWARENGTPPFVKTLQRWLDPHTNRDISVAFSITPPPRG